MKQPLQVRLIQEKSKRLKVPYQNLLTAAAKEWILEQLSLLPEEYDYRLMRTSLLNRNHYQVHVSRDLYIQLISPMRMTAEELMDKLSLTDYQLLGPWELLINVPMDKLKIPIHMVINKDIPRQNKREKIAIPLLYENDKVVELAGYSSEEELCILFTEFVEYQGLYSDMEALEAIYQTLITRHLEGRYASLSLDADPARAERALDSLSSQAMKSRFKGYLRAGKRKEPDIQEVEKAIRAFFGPIIKMKAKDEIFLGDWIPDLKRYL